MKGQLNGCALLLVVAIGLSALLMWGLGYAQDQAADYEYARGRSEAMIIHAQGQARLDSAQAAAVTLTAALPWGVLAILAILGIAVVALAVVVVTRPPRQPDTRLIERHIVYVLPAGSTRRDVWQLMSERQPLMIEAGKEIER